MHFGFSNISASFQDYIIQIFAEKLNIFDIIYLDDILIYTENLDQPHMELVYRILDQLRKHWLSINLKKY